MFKFAAVLVAVGVLVPVPAHAYLDPGTGSIIIQGLLAAITAAAVTLGVYWQRIKGFFSRSSSTQESDQDAGEGSS